jgi:ribose transport system permease protein
MTASSAQKEERSKPPRPGGRDGTGFRRIGKLGPVAVKFNLLLILLGLVVVGSMLSPAFLTTRNLFNLLQQSSVLGVMSMGMTFVILAKQIDLSVGSMSAFGGLTVAWFMVAGYGVIPSILLASAGGALLGLLMGGLSARLALPSFIVSLAGLVSIRGVTFMISDVPIGRLPDSFNWLGGRLGMVPIMGLVFISVTIVSGLVLRFSVFGEYVYATGGNEEAARLSGVPTRLVITGVFIISGGLAAFSGVLRTAWLTVGQPQAGQGMELDAIAAVVLGGTSLFGGRGGVFGTFIAVLLLSVLRNVFNLVGLGSFAQMVATGIILIAAIVLNTQIVSRSQS